MMKQGIRFMSRTCVRHNQAPLPSTPAMKSGNAWSKNQVELSEGSLTGRVVRMTKKISETSQAPLEIAPMFTKVFQQRESYDPFDFSNTRLVMDKKAYTKDFKSGASATTTTLIADPFERTGIDPRNLYCMPDILSKFITSTGQILPRAITGCNARNQKKLADAIKTARACGLLSSTHKHEKFLPMRNL